ncbi:MAG TPA: hypothetical protein VKZ79_14415 [Alphaproteobacteria bacterium]|nr:hypothetical protein [Alphaproteobacteria bacterium]
MMKRFAMATVVAFAVLASARAAPSEFGDNGALPESERNFLDLFAASQRQLDEPRSLQSISALRVDMQIRVARFMNQNPLAHGWVGVVEDSHVNRDGTAWVSIKISQDVALVTTKDRAADPDALSLIVNTSPIYPLVKGLKSGKQVVFDARLLGAQLDTDEGMIRRPQILVAFKDIKYAETGGKSAQ